MSLPKVSMIIITYRQQEVVEMAVRGALAQDYGNLEVLVSDDCSPDGTYAKLQELHDGYDGPHAFRIRRNRENRGIVGNFLAAVADSSGALVVGAAGDDLSLPERVSALVDAYLAEAERPACLYSDAWEADADGTRLGRIGRAVPDTLAQAIARQAFVVGATAAYDRRVFTEFPDLGARVQSEDIVLYLRALMLGSVRRVPEPLVEWRRGASLWKGSETDLIRRTGEKNGSMRSAAYRQAREDYAAFCLARGRVQDRTVTAALDAVIAENDGFAMLTRGAVGRFAASVIKRPGQAVAHARALRRYLRLRARR